MSLLTLISVFSVLTLVVVVLLACCLRQRLKAARRAARSLAADASPAAVKEER